MLQVALAQHSESQWNYDSAVTHAVIILAIYRLLYHDNEWPNIRTVGDTNRDLGDFSNLTLEIQSSVADYQSNC